MATGWIERVTGSLEQKKRYRQYKARTKQLPANYRTAVDALERYLMYFGAITRGDTLVSMLEDLADLFEQSAADGTPIRAVVGEDPVEFAETFLQNYSEGQWINKERERLTKAINSAAGEDTGQEEGSVS
jgi:DNA-binding ferritin-like protein (Dps family)